MDKLRPIATIGFIGLGVMGEPMCGHLTRRAGRPVLAHDRRPEPLERLTQLGVTAAAIEEIAEGCELDSAVFAGRTSGASGSGGAGPGLSAGQCVVDTSTSPVPLTREIGRGWLNGESRSRMRRWRARVRRRRAESCRSWSARAN